MEKQLYRAGGRVYQTGIYRLVHEGHLQNHQELLLLKGESFPGCELCSEGARFRAIHLAPHIVTDNDFRPQYGTRTCGIPIQLNRC